MPNVCTICRHLNVAEINKTLLDNGPLRTIADRWSVSKTALIRHKEHIPAALVRANGAKEVAKADALLDHVKNAEGRAERLYAAAEQILTRALEDGEQRTALQAIKAAVDVMSEARQYLELRGKITGEIAAPGKDPDDPNRPITIINFPVVTEEMLKAQDDAAVVIDLPHAQRRLLERPSDGKPR